MNVSQLTPADRRTARVLARLHMQCIPGGFLSSLGEGFLARLYRAIAEDPQSNVLVLAGSDAKPVDGAPAAKGTASEEQTGGQRGASLQSPDTSRVTNATAFLAGTQDTSAMYRRVLRRHWLSFSFMLLPRALSPTMLRHILETMRYGGRRSSNIRRPGSESVPRVGPGTQPKDAEPSQSIPPLPDMCAAELLAIAVAPEARGRGQGRRLLEEFERQLPVDSYKVVTDVSDPVSNAFYTACGFERAREFVHHGNGMVEYRKRVTTENAVSTTECA